MAAVRSPSGRAGALAVGFATRLDERRQVAFEALSSYAALVGLWLDDAGALLRLVRAASHDALTGCLSYTALMHELDREIRRAERSRQPLACLFVGVEGLEDARDDAGQQVANRVLIECASRLMTRARQTDLVGRYGGNAFVVVLPDTHPDGAGALADGLQGEIVDLTGELLAASPSASIGVSEWSSGIDADELIDAAAVATREQRAVR
jgi:diguanylate cyclase (GGDEF)-like protein